MGSAGAGPAETPSSPAAAAGTAGGAEAPAPSKHDALTLSDDANNASNSASKNDASALNPFDLVAGLLPELPSPPFRPPR